METVFGDGGFVQTTTFAKARNLPLSCSWIANRVVSRVVADQSGEAGQGRFHLMVCLKNGFRWTLNMCQTSTKDEPLPVLLQYLRAFFKTPTPYLANLDDDVL